jgi:hypothetical protein
VDGWRSELVVTPGGDGRLTGVMVVHLTAGEVHTTLSGAVSPAGLTLQEDHAPVTWRASFGPNPKLLEGTVVRPTGSVPFEFVKVR